MAKLASDAILSVITFSGLANGQSVEGSEINLSVAPYKSPVGSFEMVCDPASAPTAGVQMHLYAAVAIDGTNYPNNYTAGSSPVYPADMYLCSFTLKNSASLQRITVNGVPLPGPFKMKFSVLNNSGVAMDSGGAGVNEVKLVGVYEQES